MADEDERKRTTRAPLALRATEPPPRPDQTPASAEPAPTADAAQRAGPRSAVPASSKDEALVPLNRGPSGAIENATHVRGTLIVSSVLTLQAKGYFDRYLALLPEAFREAVVECVAGTWIPVAVAVAHYRAADALGLTVMQQLDMGRGVAARVQDGFLGTLVRLAKGAGVTPWTGLEYVPRLFDRVFTGGGACAVYRLGPKEARFECYGLPELAPLAYFRHAWAGMFAGSGQLFCSRVYIHDLPSFVLKRAIGFRVSWA